MAIKRFHFLVHGGTVQGVFFRAHTVSSAQKHGLTGWVRNLPSGKVEGEAQGEEEAITGFLKEVEKGPEHAHVVRLDRKEMEGLKEDVDGVFRKIKWGQEP